MINGCNIDIDINELIENIDINYNMLCAEKEFVEFAKEALRQELIDNRTPRLLTDEEFDQLIEELSDENTGTLKPITKEMLNKWFYAPKVETEPIQNTGDPNSNANQLKRNIAETLTHHQKLISMLMTSQLAIKTAKSTFRSNIYKSCIYDYNRFDNELAGSLENASQNISDYKIELCNALIKNLDLDINQENYNMDNAVEYTLFVNNVLQSASEKIKFIENQGTAFENLKLFYQLAFFDDLLETLGFTQRNNKLYKPAEHAKDMYSVSFFKDTLYKGLFNQSDKHDIDDFTSTFFREFMEYLPQKDASGKWTEGLNIGWNGFKACTTTFMNWLESQYDMYESVMAGNYEALADAWIAWMNDKKGTSTYSRTLLRMIARTLYDTIFGDYELVLNSEGNLERSLNPIIQSKLVPKEVRDVFYGQMLKTVTRSYLGYVPTSETIEGREISTIDHKLSEDSIVISESSRITNIISATVSSYRTNQNSKQTLFTKIKDFDISETQSSISGSQYLMSFKHIIDSASGPVEVPYSILWTKSKNERGNEIWRCNTFNVFSGHKNNTADANLDFMQLVYDIFKYDLGIPSSMEELNQVQEILKHVFNNDITLNEIFAPVIGLTLASIDDTAVSKLKLTINNNRPDLSKYFRDYDMLAQFLYATTGYDNKNVVRNVEDSKVPTKGLISAIKQFAIFYNNAKNAKSGTVYSELGGGDGNPILNDFISVGQPIIRDGISTKYGKKSFTQASVAEGIITSAFIDYGATIAPTEKKTKDKEKKNDNTSKFYNGRTILIQTTVYSDKSIQFVHPFTFNDASDFLRLALQRLAKDETSKETRDSDRRILENYIQTWQHKKYGVLLNKTLKKWNTVFESEIRAVNNGQLFAFNKDGLLKLDAFIKDLFSNGYEYSDIYDRVDLYNKNRRKGTKEIVFVEEIDFFKKKSFSGLNPSILYKYLNVFKDSDSTKDFFEIQRRIMIQDISEENINLYENDLKIDTLASSEWKRSDGKYILYKIYQKNADGSETLMSEIFDVNSLLNRDPEASFENLINKDYRVELNPVLDSYLYADGICSQAWEEIFFGFNENNPTKNGFDVISDSASRLIAQYKRTVPAGSTVHLFQQGLDYGVSPIFRMAVVEDPAFIYATNSIGETFDEEPHNGSAWCSPISAIYIKNSVPSVVTGTSRAKTIQHDVDEDGNGQICKWATYTITNAIRKVSGPYAKYSAERIFKKTHETCRIDLNLTVGYSTLLQKVQSYINAKLKTSTIYTKDPELSEYYKISNVELLGDPGTGYVAQITYQPVDEQGKILDSSEPIINMINLRDHHISAYDLDQIFGGRDAHEYDSSVGRLVPSDINNRAVAELLVLLGKHQNNVNFYKDQIITYVVNKSGFKRGSRNMNNGNEIFENDDPFRTITIRSSAGGVMFNTEHGVDGHVREMSQMLAALTQNGYTIRQALKIYKDIGKIIDISAKDIFEDTDINSEDRRKILQDIFVRTMGSSTKTGIGTSDAIVQYSLQENSINIPFSLEQIRAKFVSAINSHLTNESVIREYSGVQSVNTPARGMIQYYEFNGNKLSYEAVCRQLNDILFTDNNRNFLEKAWQFNGHQEPMPEKFSREQKREIINLIFNPFKKDVNGNIISIFSENANGINFIHAVEQANELAFGQTIYVEKQIDGKTTYEKVILESQQQTDEWRNLRKASVDYTRIFIHDTAPVDLKQPYIKLDIKGIVSKNKKSVFTEWDLDVVRAMYYYREFIGKKFKLSKIKFAEDKIALIKKVWPVVSASFKTGEQNVRYKKFLKSQIIPNDGFLPPDALTDSSGIREDKHLQKMVLLVMQDYQQEIMNALGSRQTGSSDSINIPMQVAFGGLDFGSKQDTVSIKRTKIEAGEIALSAAYAKQLLLRPGDDVGEILQKGPAFFEKRLSNKSEIRLNNDEYDLILYRNDGTPVVVKIGKFQNNERVFINDDYIEKGVTKVLYKGSELCNVDSYGNTIRTGTITGTDGTLYDYIEFNNINDLTRIENDSNFNKNETSFNWSDENREFLWNYAKERFYEKKRYKLESDKKPIYVDENTTPTLKQLLKHEQKRKETYIQRTARQMYSAFKNSLLYLGTRIPSQALQSCMALKVVLFVGDDSNQIFIPGAMHWFEGADYDIDKTFMMRLGLDGLKTNVLSNLDEYYDTNKVADLPIPNISRSHYKFVLGGLDETFEFVQNKIKDADYLYYGDTHYVKASALKKKRSDRFFNVIRNILEYTELAPPLRGNNIYIINDLGETAKLANEAIDRGKDLIYMLRKHNTTSLSNKRTVGQALQNRNVVNAYDILVNPANFIAEGMPIAFGEIQEKAGQSTLGGRDRFISIWEGTSKAVMHTQFQLGKQEIGIVASAIKAYLIKNTVVNAAIDKAVQLLNSNQISEAFDVLKNYTFNLKDASGQERVCLLANANLEPLFKALDSLSDNDGHLKVFGLPSKYINFVVPGTGLFDVKRFKEDLLTFNAEEDVLMALSALLSAATDNAKELILKKINASTTTVDLFCAMLGMGYSLQEILTVFESPYFSIVDKLTTNNIYEDGADKVSLEDAMRFVLGKKMTALSAADERKFTWLLTSKFFLFEDDKFIYNKELEALYKTISEIPVENYKKYKDTEEDPQKLVTRFLQTILNPNDENVWNITLTRIFKLFDKIEEITPQRSKYVRDYNSEYDDDIDTEDDDEIVPDEDNVSTDGYIDWELDDSDDNDNVNRFQKELKIENFSITDLKKFRKTINNIIYKVKKINSFKNSDALRDVKDRRNWDDDEHYMNLVLNEIIPASEENKIIAKCASVNQGLVSTSKDMYSFIKTIESYVNGVTRSKEAIGWTNEYLNSKNLPADTKFDLIRFLTDPEYQDVWIDIVEHVRKHTNVLRYIMESPNFGKMFSVYAIAKENAEYQFVARFTPILADAICNNIYKGKGFHKLSSQQYETVEKLVIDYLPVLFLNTVLPRNKRTFTLKNAGQKYYLDVLTDIDGEKMKNVSEGESINIDLKTSSGMATFKYLMENDIWSALKDNAKFKNEPFVRNLHLTTVFNNIQHSIHTIMSLGIDMTNVSTSAVLSQKFDSIQSSFIKMKDIKLNELLDLDTDLTIGDAFYLYNLILYKDGSNKNAFTKLFGTSLEMFLGEKSTPIEDRSVMRLYWDFLNALDKRTDPRSTQELSDARLNEIIQADIINSIDINALVNDALFRLADDAALRSKINEQQEEDRIKYLIKSNSEGKQILVGWIIDGKATYFNSNGLEDFMLYLPFSADIKSDIYKWDNITKSERLHNYTRIEFARDFVGHLAKISTKDGLPLLIADELDWELNVPSDLQYEPMVVLNGIVHLNMNLINENTPAFVFVKLLSTIANYYQDSSGHYPYKESWRAMLNEFQNSSEFLHIMETMEKQIPTFKNYVENNIRQTVLERTYVEFIKTKLMTPQKLSSINNTIMSDEKFNAMIQKMFNTMFGIDMQIKDVPTLTTSTIGDLLQNFGKIVPTIELNSEKGNGLTSTIFTENAAVNLAIKHLIASKLLTLEGDC